MLLHLLVLLAWVTCSPEVCCAHLPSAGPRACRCPPVHSASVVSSPKEELGGLRENQEQGLRENQERGLRENQERGLRETQERGLRETQERGLRETQERGLREIGRAHV